MIYATLAFIVLIIVAAITGKKPAEGFDSIAGHMGLLNKGFALRGGLLATTQEQAMKNALVVGATGSGKTTAVLISSLYSLSRGNASMVVLDVSSENRKLTSGYFATKKKYNVYSLDFTEASDGINPITLCKNTEELERVAHTLIKNAGVDSKGDPFWASAAEGVLSLFMQLVFYYVEEEHKNMANVVLLLQTYMTEPSKTDLLFIKTKDQRLLRNYKALNSVPEKTRQSILSTALTATKLFTSTSVARCTAVNTIDFKSFRETPSILYLCIPLNQVNFLAPLSAVLFDLLFQEALSRIPDRNELPIFFMIDEMATLKLDYGLFYSNCRKYRCGAMSLIQDEYMLRMKNTDAECFAIKSNSLNKVYLPGLSMEASKNLQEIIGKGVIKDQDGKERQGYFMEASEIRKISGEAIILINSAVLKEPVKPYYSHFVYNARTKIPPYQPPRKIPFNEPPLIQF